MADVLQKSMLITRQRPAIDAATEESLRQLAAEFGYDLYTTRQRLLGAGMVLLDSGERADLQARASILLRNGFPAWVITPTVPHLLADRLVGVERSADALQLQTTKGTVTLRRGMTAVGVLAELTGALEAKLGKRLWANTLYRGTTDDVVFDEQEIRRTILLNTPVFDLYLLDEKRVTACVRAWPGRFDPKGLGEQAGVSSKANLDLLVRQVAELAEPFTLHTHFGLSLLPGCKIMREAEGKEWKESTVRSLTRFGWLMTDLALQPQPEIPETGAPGVGTLAAAALLGRPELVAGGAALSAHPELRAVAETIDAELADTAPPPAPATAPKAAELPPPPHPPDTGPISWRIVLPIAGAALAFGVSHLHAVATPLGRLLASGFSSGVLPGMACVLLFAFGINRFRLKQIIENTPTSRIRSLAMGLVEVQGRARRKYALVAPMSQSPCVWYRLRTYRKRGDSWRQVSDSSSGHVPFVLDDGSGRVTIDPAGALVRAGTRHEGFGAQATMLFGLSGSGGDEKWIEESIAEGETLYVLGSASPLRGERRSLHQRKLERLRELKTDRNALAAYDANGDGRIDEQEWLAAREAVEDQVAREHLQERVVPQRVEETTVIARSRHRSHPFVIASARTEAQLATTYAWIGGLQLAGALVLLIWTISAVVRYVG